LIESPTRPQLDSGTPSTSEEADTGSRRYGGNHRRNEERIDLKTKYFQITERSDVVNDVIDVIGGGDALSTSTARPYSRPPSKILVKNSARSSRVRGSRPRRPQNDQQVSISQMLIKSVEFDPLLMHEANSF
jgi:hypothetical protein